MTDTENGARLAVSGDDMRLFSGTQISYKGKMCKLCPLTADNSKSLRQLFDFTNPKSHRERSVTIGLGDRLGIASAGHIRAIRDFDIFPVLAQQSIRELTLTGRTFEDVLAAAVWAVFREGYDKGYGADGDHLKTHAEVAYALESGFSMITLDCSEHIRDTFAFAPQQIVDEHYAAIPQDEASALENEYLNRSFSIGCGMTIEFSVADFRRAVLVYLPAVYHAISIYDQHLAGAGVDFEVSIDETSCATSPQSHFFVANELVRRGADIASIAPRFPGEFQKGIDYIGDIREFERDFRVHAGIAEKFGYKISVHSGSDKFSIFPIVGKLTGNKYHLKTAGTSWLEAIRIVAKTAPDLYREIHGFALEHLQEAKKYYYTTEDAANITGITGVCDADLPGFLDNEDARRVLHITYGLILQANTDSGASLFRDRLYAVLREHEAEYIETLERHIGSHLAALGAAQEPHDAGRITHKQGGDAR